MRKWPGTILITVVAVLATAAGLVFRIFDPVMIGAVAFIALVSNITVLQRLFFVKTWERQTSASRKTP